MSILFKSKVRINRMNLKNLNFPTKTAKEEPPEMTINLEEVKFIKYLPTCPKCKLTNDVFFFNVTKEIYECTRCNLRFRFAKEMG
jgi:DNA-directed RNA polymerase subunit M/transcription elongation factor TFIIS